MTSSSECIADLHVHSYLSRATSRRMQLGTMARWAQLKGISLLGTGDITHPVWRSQLQARLEPAEAGLFRLETSGQFDEPLEDLPQSCRRDVRFILSGEISNVYRRDGKTRRVHNLVFFPDFAAADRFAQSLSQRGNIAADGRPILGLDSEELLRMVIRASAEAFLVPAHVWTPHYSLFGATSSFSSVEECYGDLAEHVRAIETGLSSDPPMNWRLSALDCLTLISNSDAHSPEKLGREATIFTRPLSFAAIKSAIETGIGLLGTIEYHPEEGKYHLDGHRPCRHRCTPVQTQQSGGRCPHCGGKLTVGVLHRIDELADRPSGHVPSSAKPFERLIPLHEILAEILGLKGTTKTVRYLYHRLVAGAGGEFTLLRELTRAAIVDLTGEPVLAEALIRVRQGRVSIEAGYDGSYGRVHIFSADERRQWQGRKLFPSP